MTNKALTLWHFIYRHVLTAGHCVCNKKKESAYRCLSPESNQIKEGMNDIVILGGSKRLSVMVNAGESYKYRWKADKAYIMSSQSFEDDFGIIELTDKVLDKLTNKLIDKVFF